MSNTKTAAAQNDYHPCACSRFFAHVNGSPTRSTGCVAITRNTFAQGHDAKLKSFLIKAGAEGYEVSWNNGGVLLSASAQAVADNFGFGYMVRNGIKHLADKWAKRENAANRREAKQASASVPATVEAKVGRWVYEGVLDGETFVYQDKKGNRREADQYTLI